MRWPPEKIAALRKAYGEKQHEFCRRLGVSEAALGHWEYGVRVPSGMACELLDRLEEELKSGSKRKLATAS